MRADPQLTRHIDDLYPTLDSIVDAAEHAQGLMAAPGWEVMCGLLEAEIDLIDTKLDSGRTLDHVEYASAHGRRGGLRAPQTVLKALVSRAETRLNEQRSKHEGTGESAPEGGS